MIELSPTNIIRVNSVKLKEDTLAKLADEYYRNVLIKEYGMEENMAKHCRLAYLQGMEKGIEYVSE